MESRTLDVLFSQLHLAVRPYLISLGGALLSTGLISSENYYMLMNRSLSEAYRSDELLHLLRDKVHLNSQNYHTFIGILQDEPEFAAILEILNQTYSSHQQGDGKWQLGQLRTC